MLSRIGADMFFSNSSFNFCNCPFPLDHFCHYFLANNILVGFKHSIAFFQISLYALFMFILMKMFHSCEAQKPFAFIYSEW